MIELSNALQGLKRGPQVTMCLDCSQQGETDVLKMAALGA